MNDKLLVKDIGEHGLLARLQRFCPADVVGDDGAILSLTADRSLVVTTDVLVDEVHFSDRTTSPFDVGWRAVAANLSDLAAMGAKPVGITVGLSLPGTTEVAWVEAVYRGISACLEAYHTDLVGGDICRSQVVSLAITALGEVFPQRAIRRHHARPGDAIVVTGWHGLSRGGLELLLDPTLSNALTESESALLIEAHQRPKPRLDVLPYLAAILPQIAIAGMDSSDGLRDAIEQICQRSGVGAKIDRAKVEVFAGLTKLANSETAWSWVLDGGEDFELVLCLPEMYALSLLKKLDERAAIIGKIIKTQQIELIDSSRNADFAKPQILKQGKIFRHF